MDEIHEEHAVQHTETEGSAKILPFNKLENKEAATEEHSSEAAAPRFVTQAKPTSQFAPAYEHVEAPAKAALVEHKEDENMSSFILVEKNRLQQSQKSLKQKEIINLYQKNSNIDVEQIKSTNQNPSTASEAGVLVNKKQY
jgi:hypothetical protein